MNKLTDLGRFYSILEKLDASQQQGLKLGLYSGTSHLPLRGVHFFREPGELRSSSAGSHRIVRVGTHAVSANAKSTLWQRLRAHLGTREGSGNHRGSIFRRHVGAALLARDQVTLPTWGLGSSAPPALRDSHATQELELACERKVSKYIGSMTVLWVDVPDEPGPSSTRAIIERNAIALLSNYLTPIEPASSDWLGHHSPREGIRKSNLWNLDYVNQTYDPSFLDLLECAVHRTLESGLSRPV